MPRMNACQLDRAPGSSANPTAANTKAMSIAAAAIAYVRTRPTAVDIVLLAHVERRNHHLGRDGGPRRLLPRRVGCNSAPRSELSWEEESRDVRDHLSTSGGRDARDGRTNMQRDVERLVERIVVLEECPFEEPRDEDQVPRG